MMHPRVGCTVRLNSGGIEVAGIVTKVNLDGTVNVQAFPDGGLPIALKSVTRAASEDLQSGEWALAEPMQVVA